MGSSAPVAQAATPRIVDLSSTTTQQRTSPGARSDDPAGATTSGGGLLFELAPALAFLAALGKDPKACRVRAFAHKDNPHRAEIGARKGQGLDQRQLIRWLQEGRSLYVVINEGGDTKASITRCVAFFVEWDDRPIAWQLVAWEELGLPEPSLMVSSGGKSVHCYWVLEEPITPEQWEPIQTQLIAYCGADPDCNGLARVMRLPGASYIGPDGKPTGQRAEILHDSGHRYRLLDLVACLPNPEAKPAPAAPQRPAERWPIPLDEGRLLPGARAMSEVREALGKIPEILPKTGQRDRFRDLAWGLLCAVREAGQDKEVALALLQEHCPSVTDAAEYLQTEPHSITAGTFWDMARKAGHNLSREASRPVVVTPSHQPQQQASKPRRSGKRTIGHTRALGLLDRAVAHLTRRCRNTLTRRARLLRIIKALGLTSEINRQELAQRVLEASAAHQGQTFRPLNAADRLAMERPAVVWLMPGLVPANDLTIIGGRPKVGKTRLAVALAAAVLNGTDFLGSTPPTPRPVVLVSDDQADGDTADMLEALGLWHHPQLIWSPHFRLTERDLEALLETIRANPGALVILDSLRSIARALTPTENDPELGAALYDLKGAVIEAGGTLALVHHCNKGEGLVGIEALSGHTAIAGAANTVITLHYLPGADGKPIKDDPHRRLFVEGRSGSNRDLVIAPTAGRGGFHCAGTFADWKQRAEAATVASKLTPVQQQALEVLEDAEGWLTRRQVTEAMEVPWENRGKNPEARRVELALRRLVELGLAEQQRAGTEAAWRIASHEAQETTGTTGPTSPRLGSESTGSAGDSENARPDWVAPLSPLSRAPEASGNVEGLEVGAQVEVLIGIPPAWVPGWRVAHVEDDSARVELGTDFRVLPLERIRAQGQEVQA
jgi:hypothetical protein